MFPTKITSSIVYTELNLKNLVGRSLTFIATFEDGTQKLLNKKDRIRKSLLKSTDKFGVTYEELVRPEQNNLYHRNWSKVPALGNYNTDYPWN